MALLHLLPLLALAACAAPPGPPVEPPVPYPPAARQRLLRIALAEWAEWGRIVTEPPWLRPRPVPAEAGPAAAAPGPESAVANFPRVLAYWRAVPEDEGAVARNRAAYRTALDGHADDDGHRLWAEPPWSAAFISFLMRTAGVDRREFPPAAAHATYVDALLADASAFPTLAPFLPHAPDAYPPRPGDLICADRSAGRPPLRDWRDRAAETGRFRPMHCDLVVAVHPGRVEAVGGNVRDAVTLTRFPTDAGGVLLPPPPEAPAAPAWFAVFENRLGLLPPWGPAAFPAAATPVAAAASTLSCRSQEPCPP